MRHGVSEEVKAWRKVNGESGVQPGIPMKGGRHAQPSGQRGFVDIRGEVFEEETENVEMRDVSKEVAYPSQDITEKPTSHKLNNSVRELARGIMSSKLTGTARNLIPTTEIRIKFSRKRSE